MDETEAPSIEAELESASSYCKKMFSSRYSKLNKCPFCNKLEPCKSRMETHIRIHTGEKPFQCNICKKEFADNSNFQVHMRCHSGDRSYKCSLCSKAYFRPNALIRHEMIKHGRPAGRRKKSHALGLENGDSSCDTKCPYCEKMCTSAVTLKRHIRVHTGERPFKCNVCQKEFTDNSNYHRHMRSHSGEKNFKCCVCSKAFCRKDVLVRHEVEMHGKHPSRKRDDDDD